MVQGLSSNNYGSISRIGNSNDGRVIYQVSDPDGKVAGKISVAEQSCDVFEKSYNDLLESAPMMQKIAEDYQNPKKQEQIRKTNLWSKIIGASVGLLASSALTRKLKHGWQALICIPSAVAGLALGAYTGARLTTPKEAVKFTQAMQNMSKLDIRPYEG